MKHIPSFTILSAMSLNIPTDAHPNKMPFSGILTRIGEPSDSAPHGSGGKRVMITVDAAERALPSLLGMGVNYNPDGHSPQEKIGIIDSATIEANAIRIGGFIYASDFPKVAEEIKANKDRLGFSFEARDLFTVDANADPVPIVDCVFTGAAILLKEKAAYTSTSIQAASAANPEGEKMSKLIEVINAVAGLTSERKATLIAELSAAGAVEAASGDKVIYSLKAAHDALVGDQNTYTPIQRLYAANGDKTIEKRLKDLKKACAKVGYDLDFNARIDLDKFDQVAAGKSPELRMGIKAEMGRLGLAVLGKPVEFPRF